MKFFAPLIPPVMYFKTRAIPATDVQSENFPRYKNYLYKLHSHLSKFCADRMNNTAYSKLCSIAPELRQRHRQEAHQLIGPGKKTPHH